MTTTMKEIKKKERKKERQKDRERERQKERQTTCSLILRGSNKSALDATFT